MGVLLLDFERSQTIICGRNVDVVRKKTPDDHVMAVIWHGGQRSPGSASNHPAGSPPQSRAYPGMMHGG